MSKSDGAGIYVHIIKNEKMKTTAIAAMLVVCSSLAGVASGETALPAATPEAGNQPLVLKIGVNDIYCRKTACSCIEYIAKRSYDGTLAMLAKDGLKLEFTSFREVIASSISVSR